MTEIKKIHCNACKHKTNHELKSEHFSYNEELEETRYRFFICQGCDTASIEERQNITWIADDYYIFSYFPERSNKESRLEKKFKHIDEKLNAAYLEIIKSYNQGLEIMSAIGIRALLEGICVQEGINDKIAYNLTGKIKKLQSDNKIPEGIIEGLNNLKFIGDDAAHRLTASNKDTIRLSIDLLEALLTHLYEAKFELHHRAELVKNNHKSQVSKEE